MKKLLIIIAAMVLIFAAKTQARPIGVSFGFFYSSLQPYGEWVAVDNDLYAFRPQVYNGWEPYSDGRWVWTPNGWYWDSYEPFGWATFHYGRWYYDDYYGWMWLPDYEWGPSWVEWRYDDDYIGWAPLSPYAAYNINVGIHYNYDWHFPYHHWHYVDFHHFNDYHVNKYFVGDKYKYRIHSRTKYRDNYDYRDGRVINRGVDKDFVERRSGTRIPERQIVETTRLRNNGGDRDRDRVEVYRPGKDELEKTRNIEKFDIKRTDRKIALDVSKVENRTVIRNRDNERQDLKVEKADKNEVRIQNHGNKDNVRVQNSDNNRNEVKVQKPDNRNDVRVQKPDNRNDIRVQKSDRNNDIRIQNETRNNVRVQKPNNRDEVRIQKPSNNEPRVEKRNTPEMRERNSSRNETQSRRSENKSSGNDRRAKSSGGERRR